MEQITREINVTPARHYGGRALLAAGLVVTPMVAAGPVSADTTQPAITWGSDQESPIWRRQWEGTFDDPTLGSHWQVKDNLSEKWDRFSQYRQFNVTLRGGKLILTSRRHCVTPGEDLTLANAQVATCPPGTLTEYSSGRVEELDPSVVGNYRVEVEAKLPEDEGVQAAIWANTIDKEDELNAGYCIKGSETPTDEVDLVESYGDDVAHASHHVYCKDGELEEVSRIKRFKRGWLTKLHTFVAERIGNRTTLYVDGDPMRITGSSPAQYTDTPRDYKNTSRSEFAQASNRPYHMIFSLFVPEASHAPNESFQAPRADLPYTNKQLKIESITVSTY